MLVSFNALRTTLWTIIRNKAEQGHVTEGLEARLSSLPDSYDALAEFSREVADLPLREDWDYVEPDGLGEILGECDPARPKGHLEEIPERMAARIETAFLASVCGCMLGKPVEINPTLMELRTALQATGDWPLQDYISEKIAPHLPRPMHDSWTGTVRERMVCAVPDDDVNYTVLGMLVLENHGTRFDHAQLAKMWFRHLPLGTTFGPERMTLLKIGMNTLVGAGTDDFSQYARYLNPGDELCGALIRADAYGYACPGNPALAAELAWRDASLTHRRTGVYGTMFVAAAIAVAAVFNDPLEIFSTALQFVPRRSRLYRIIEDSLQEVALARDWLDGYERIHGRYRDFGHCRIVQEIGTLINTLRFAENIGDGICKQVSQGNDTDSFGATAGSLLGMYFGPGHLDSRWLDPLHDTLHTTLADFHEQSLSVVAARMGQLPEIISRPGLE